MVDATEAMHYPVVNCMHVLLLLPVVAEKGAEHWYVQYSIATEVLVVVLLAEMAAADSRLIVHGPPAITFVSWCVGTRGHASVLLPCTTTAYRSIIIITPSDSRSFQIFVHTDRTIILCPLSVILVIGHQENPL